MLIVFDLEADGLYEDVTTMWCGVIYHDKKFTKYRPHQLTEFVNTLHSLGKQGHTLCGHNIIDYDIPTIEKLYGISFSGIKVLDTLVMSRLADPERTGRHSLDAWGERIGVPKPKHEDWTQFTEDMLHRCHQDVNINARIVPILCRELGITLEEAEQLAREYF